MKVRHIEKKIPQYHYVMTVEGVVNGKPRWASVEGVVEFIGTRHEAFVDRWEFACNTIGCDREGVKVLFWSFEPNELPPTSSQDLQVI